MQTTTIYFLGGGDVTTFEGAPTVQIWGIEWRDEDGVHRVPWTMIVRVDTTPGSAQQIEAL